MSTKSYNNIYKLTNELKEYNNQQQTQQDDTIDDEELLTSDDKKYLRQKITQYNELGTQLSINNLNETVGIIIKLTKYAKHIIEQNPKDWWDNMTISRDMKHLIDSVKLLEKTSNEIKQLNHRLYATYEDIGYKLNRYFKIK